MHDWSLKVAEEPVCKYQLKIEALTVTLNLSLFFLFIKLLNLWHDETELELDRGILLQLLFVTSQKEQ